MNLDLAHAGRASADQVLDFRTTVLDRQVGRAVARDRGLRLGFGDLDVSGFEIGCVGGRNQQRGGERCPKSDNAPWPDPIA